MPNEEKVEVSEQVEETSVANTQPDTDSAKADEIKTQTFSQEDVNRAVQSASSKGKNEVLKSLGITSIDEGRTKLEQAETLVQTNNDLSKQLEETKETLVLTQNQVDEKKFNDVKVLAKSRVSEQKDFASAVKEVITENPQWRQQAIKVDMGAKDGDSKQESKIPGSKKELSPELLERFPWLAKK